MRKRSAQLFVLLIFTILLVSTVSASIKSNKGTYHTKELVFVSSTIGANDHLCRSQNPEEKADVFIVLHEDDWDDGDSFVDVRGEPSEIPNSRFASTKVWENPEIGTYDLVVDCNNNNAYDESSEPLYNKGFIVYPKKGQGSMSLGKGNPANFEWQFDPESDNSQKPIFQINLLAIDEDIDIETINVEIDSPVEVSNVEIFFDKNGNGVIDGDDKWIARGESIRKSGDISIDFKARMDIDENILFVINTDENSIKGDYKIKVVSIQGTGALSEKEIRFFGNPLESNTMKVVDKKSCLGEIELELTPNPEDPTGKVIAKASGLKGCDNKEVNIKSKECFVLIGGLETCELKEGFCEVEIDAIKGKYFACIDKNQDGNYNGFGESTSLNLEIEEEKIETSTKEPKQENNEEEDPSKITGNVIGNLSNLNLDNNLLIALEITLLLILVFLALIFYKVLNPSKTTPTTEEKEDDSELPKEETKEEKEDQEEDDKKEEIFEELEERKKEIVDKVEKEKKDSKKK